MSLSPRSQLNRRALELRLREQTRAPVASPGQSDRTRWGVLVWSTTGGHGLALGQVVALAGSAWVPAVFASHAGALLGIVSAVLSADDAEITTAGELPAGIVLAVEEGQTAASGGWLGPVAGALRGSAYDEPMPGDPAGLLGHPDMAWTSRVDPRQVVSVYAAAGVASLRVCANEWGQRHQPNVYGLAGFRVHDSAVSDAPHEDRILVSITDTSLFGSPEHPESYCIWREQSALRSGLLRVTGPAVLAKADTGDGAAAGLAATADERVLGRWGGTLQWGQITAGCIANGAIVSGHIVAGSIVAAHLSSQCVTATAILDRAVGGMQLVKAKAYSLWGNAGDTDATVQEITASADGQVLRRWGGTIAWGSSLTLGTAADGGGTLRIYTAAGTYTDIAADGTVTVYQSATTKTVIGADGRITNYRGGTAYAVCDVATITSSTTAPSGAGVKGQLHLIY